MSDLFRFTEARESRETGGNPPYYISRWHASGSDSESFVRNYAIQATSNAVATVHGTVWRKDIQVEPAGFKLWDVTVHYTDMETAVGSYSVSFDTTGGTTHITNSLETVRGYKVGGGFAPGEFAANGIPNHKTSIGAHQHGVDGVDIVIPSLKIVVDFSHPAGHCNMAYVKHLARNTGKFNSDVFLTFQPGEVLFLGTTGRWGPQTETNLSYKFALSENASGLSFGELTGIDKKGWEHAWVSHRSDEDQGKGVKVPQYVYVERVYEPVALATALGFGG